MRFHNVMVFCNWLFWWMRKNRFGRWLVLKKQQVFKNPEKSYWRKIKWKWHQKIKKNIKENLDLRLSGLTPFICLFFYLDMGSWGHICTLPLASILVLTDFFPCKSTETMIKDPCRKFGLIMTMYCIFPSAEMKCLVPVAAYFTVRTFNKLWNQVNVWWNKTFKFGSKWCIGSQCTILNISTKSPKLRTEPLNITDKLKYNKPPR